MKDERQIDDVLDLIMDSANRVIKIKTERENIDFKFEEIEDRDLGTCKAFIAYGAEGDVFSIFYNRENNKPSRIVLIKNHD